MLNKFEEFFQINKIIINQRVPINIDDALINNNKSPAKIKFPIPNTNKIIQMKQELTVLILKSPDVKTMS